ncbi:MAG: universal stress protein, partial [Streptosporangiales bacterium]|nr:universal stress protein [Streptosporangiales bacterium]
MAPDAVVVGVDGSDAAMDAAAWAAEEAALRQRPLRIVHGFLWPGYGAGAAFMYDPAVGDLRDAADAVVTTAVEHAKKAAPEVACTGEVIPGAAAPTLIRESKGAELVVVGSRGLGGFAGLLVGSVGVSVAAHAASPIVVVRPRTDGQGVGAGRIVVGVDGSPTALRAVRFAFDEARRRQVGVTAVYGGEGDVPAAGADAARAAGV